MKHFDLKIIFTIYYYVLRIFYLDNEFKNLTNLNWEFIKIFVMITISFYFGILS